MSIPLNLVIGFLGSGKTAFLKHYLAHFGGERKIAIVQNEFGPVSIDGGELKTTGDYQILEINNGSAFCVCLLGSFKESLSQFIDDIQPDEILMEASGLSDPIGVGQIFQAQELKDKVYLEHVWCLLDAVNFEKAAALRNRINHQIRIADTVIINKTDLYNGDVRAIVQMVKKVNPFVLVELSSFGKVKLTGLKRALNLFPAITKQGGGRPPLRSEVIKSAYAISTSKLNVFLDEIKTKVIRYKGFVKIEGGKTVFVQGVYDDYVLKEVEANSEPTELVVICDKLEDTNFQDLFDARY